MNALAQPGKVFSIEENVKRLVGNGALQGGGPDPAGQLAFLL